MSNALAIAAVTATLRGLLTTTLASGQSSLNLPAGIDVTTLPPDKAQPSGESAGRINLVLYQTSINAAWRNQDMPQQVKPNETGQPPLALDLHYMITAYAKEAGDGDVIAHQILGAAMSALHDHPLLGAAEIEAALPGSELPNQVERVRITPQPLSLEEISKLWMIFQSSYRISAAYQVEVVLIESTRRARTPLPVLTRGKDDSGVAAEPDLIPPFPTLISVVPDVQPPGAEPTAILGNDLLLTGHHLDGSSVVVEIKHPRLPDAIVLPAPTVATSKLIKVALALAPDDLPPGICTVSALVTRPGETARRTNEIPLAVAPTIDTDNLTVDAPSGSDRTVTVGFAPQVLPEQRVSLLLGEFEVIADSERNKTDEITFLVTEIPADEYFVRLRVDGVDSLLVNRSLKPPQFDPTQKVTIP